ncbi:GTPase IMAP family member 6-like [Polymixia lowei]
MASKLSQPGSNISPDLRLILVGLDRVGKSAAGNHILGREEFASNLSFNPVTLKSEKREGLVYDRTVTVVDTPGLLSDRLYEELVKTELEEALRLTEPGPNAFLLVVQLGNFTQQDQGAMEMLERMLCPAVSDYTLVLFTYGDRLENTNMEQFIREDKNLKELVQKCGGRYHVFNNMTEDTNEVRELLDKIVVMTEREHPYYERSMTTYGRKLGSEKSR